MRISVFLNEIYGLHEEKKEERDNITYKYVIRLIHSILLQYKYETKIRRFYLKIFLYIW